MSITADPASRLTSTIDQQVSVSLVQTRDYQQNQSGGKAVMSITADPAPHHRSAGICIFSTGQRLSTEPEWMESSHVHHSRSCL